MAIPDTLLPVRLDRAEYTITRYHQVAPVGTTVEHLFDPDYWVHVARRLKMHDEIRVVAADGSFDIELTVVAVDYRGLWAQVAERLARVPAAIRLPAPAGVWPDKDGYRIEFSGAHQWRILDRAGNVVDKGLPDEAAALAKLRAVKAEKKAA